MSNFRKQLSATVPAIFIAFAAMHAQAQDNVFISDGVPIHYEDIGGEGAPVVLIHSFASSSEMWAQAGVVGDGDYRYISIDARGHGLSGKPAGAESYGTAMVADVVGLLDWLNIEAAHIAGYSMGAEIALKLTVDHPELVLSLTVGGSGWSGEPEYGLYQFIGSSIGDTTSFADWIRNMDPEMSDEEFGYLAGMLEAHGIRGENQDTGALAAVALGMNGLIDLTEDELAAINVPVLGVAGELDAERPNIEAMIGVVPNFTMVVIEDADHLDAPLAPEFRDSIAAFLAVQR